MRPGAQVDKVVDGAKKFVYGAGNSEKGHLPGVAVDNDMLDGAPNPFGEIMKAREQELVQLPARARTEELNGLSSLLTPASKGKGKGLTQQQLAVLRDDSHELVADFFGGDKAARANAHAVVPAMAAAGEPRSNEHGGLLAAADVAEEGVASPDVKRAARMRAEAAKVMRERADAREMRDKGEERRARAQKRKAEQLALKLDGKLPVREEGALLAQSEEKYVHALESKLGVSSFERTAQEQRAQEHRILHASARAPAREQQVAGPNGAEDAAVRREEVRLEKQAMKKAAQEIGLPTRVLSERVHAHLAARPAPRLVSTDSELRREEMRLEGAAMQKAAKEIGEPQRDLRRRVRARLMARKRKQHAPPELDINMVGAHRQVGPHGAAVVDEGDLESLDKLVFGTATTRAAKAKKAVLPGVHLWGLSMSRDIKDAAKAAWKDDLKEMHLSHEHSQSGLRDGIWSGREAASMKAARLQQLALPSSALASAIWPSGHAADERIKTRDLVSLGGAEDFSRSGVLPPNSVNSDTRFARGSWRDDVTAPCDSSDAGLCDEAHAQPTVIIGRAPAARRKSAVTQQLSEGEQEQLDRVQRRVQARRAQDAAVSDESVSSMMLSAMGKDPAPYEERKAARRVGRESPGLLQMMKGVWAGEGGAGAEWHKCSHSDIDCPPEEMGGFSAKEPRNHISGEYQAPRWPADPVRAHYSKRLDGQADARDYYNDDIVTPMRHNVIDAPEKPDPSFQKVEYKPHEGFNATRAEEDDEYSYPHLVRWDKEKWKEAAAADAEADAGEESDEGHEENDESPEDVKEEEEEEEQETGLRPGTLTMKPGHYAENVTWEGIARKRLNDTFSGTPAEDGSNKWSDSPVDDSDDQGADDFLEYEPQHMYMKSLDGEPRPNLKWWF
jgi:hypothetical protein